jgi:tmRNA-binding protein
MSVARDKIRLLKRKVAKEMLTLNYTIEKDGVELSEINKLMINERQINDLMDSLVEHGYTVLAMSVESDTITPTIHWTERTN